MNKIHVLITTSILVVACTKTGLEYVCTENTQCTSVQQPVAQCVLLTGLPGACAFPASDCPSGFRYDESASNGRAKQCVVYADMTTNIDMNAPLRWTPEVSGVTNSFYEIWGSSSNDVYVAGDGNFILHSVGDGVWEKQSTNVSGTSLLGLWGSSATDIYAVGSAADGPTILHSTGNKTWARHTIDTKISPVAVWGTSAADVYIVGNNISKQGIIGHSTSLGNWSVTPIDAALTTITGTGAMSLFAGDQTGRIFNIAGPNGPFTPKIIGDSKLWISKIQTSSSGAVFAAATQGPGYNGKIFRLTNDAWTPVTDSLPAITDFWVSPTNIIYAVHLNAAPRVVSYTDGDGHWTSTKLPGTENNWLQTVWGSGDNDVYVGSMGGDIIHGKR